MSINLSRRGLLGMLAAGVGAAIVRPGVLMPIKPAFEVWKTHLVPYADLAHLEGFSQTVAQTLFYGDDRAPREYSGFTPFYTSIPASAWRKYNQGAPMFTGRSVVMEFPKGTNEGLRLVKA